jgi:hypothetical protein
MMPCVDTSRHVHILWSPKVCCHGVARTLVKHQQAAAAALFWSLTCVDWAGGAGCGHIHHTVLDVNNLCNSHTHLLLTHKASLNHVLQAAAEAAEYRGQQASVAQATVHTDDAIGQQDLV